MQAGNLGSSGRDKRGLSLEAFAVLIGMLLHSKISANPSRLSMRSVGRIEKHVIRGCTATSVARCQLQILVHGPSGPMRRRREAAGVRRCCHQIPTLKAANEKREMMTGRL
jgi:hypothetical protein